MAKDHPDIVFYPPVLAALAPLAAWGLHVLAPLDIVPDDGLFRLTGVAVLALANALGITAIYVFKARGTNVSPHHPGLRIVTAGPYRYTRNPMYLGIALFQLGLGLATPLDWAIGIAPLALAALHFGVVLREEAYLTAKFGAPYTDYLNSTRRWV